MSAIRSSDSSLLLPKMDTEFTDACRNLVLLSANGSLNENDNNLVELISQCSNYFLRKLVNETVQTAETNEVTYDDISELVHSNDQPWLAVFRETFRKRISMEEVMNRRKKTMKGVYFFDYTHYNRHNKEDGEQKSKESAEKTPKTQKKEKRKKEDDPLPTPSEFSSKKRKIIPKKPFEN